MYWTLPGRAGILFLFRIAYYQLNDYPKALRAYQEGAEIIAPEDMMLKSDFYGQIGDIYYQMDQMEKRLNPMKKHLRIMSGMWWSWTIMLISWLYIQTGFE